MKIHRIAKILMASAVLASSASAATINGFSGVFAPGKEILGGNGYSAFEYSENNTVLTLTVSNGLWGQFVWFNDGSIESVSFDYEIRRISGTAEWHGSPNPNQLQFGLHTNSGSNYTLLTPDSGTEDTSGHFSASLADLSGPVSMFEFYTYSWNGVFYEVIISNFTYEASIPEPSTWALLSAGAVGLVAVARRRG